MTVVEKKCCQQLYINNKNGTWTEVEDHDFKKKFPILLEEYRSRTQSRDFTSLDRDGDNKNDNWTEQIYGTNNISQLIDIDGDGVFDLADKNGDRGYVNVETIDGIVKVAPWKNRIYGNIIEGGGGQFWDLNGDGLQDFVMSKRYREEVGYGLPDIIEITEHMYINEGNNKYVDYKGKFNLPTQFYRYTDPKRGSARQQYYHFRFLDEDLDGLVDVLE